MPGGCSSPALLWAPAHAETRVYLIRGWFGVFSIDKNPTVQARLVEAIALAKRP